MYSRLEKISIVLRMLYWAVLLYMLMDFALSYVSVGMKPVYAVWLVAGIVVSYVIRDLSHYIIVNILLHLIPAAALFWFADGYFLKGVVVVIAIILMADSSVYIHKDYEYSRLGDAPLSAFIPAVFITAIGAYMGDSHIRMLGYVCPVVLYIIFMLRMYVQGMMGYVRSQSGVTGLPLDRIVPVNSLVVCCILTMLTLFIILADYLQLYDVTYKFVKALLTLVKIIVQVILLIMSILASLLSSGTAGMGNQMQAIEQTAEDANLFGVIMEFIMKATVTLILMYMVIMLFRRIIRVFFLKHRSTIDQVEELRRARKKDTDEEKLPKRRVPGALTPEARARRIYRKRVLSMKDRFKPFETYTTGDIRRALSSYSMSEDGARRLTRLYDGVRYGEVKPDIDYLNDMKNAR